jgi:phosphatidyl-myo-inositol alpha-mannosyltransferase
VRIAIACPYAWDVPGGVQVHVRQLADHLRRRGHRTLVLAPAFGPIDEPGVSVVGRPVRLRFNGSVAPISPDPRGLARVRRALASFRPDVVHVHEPFSPSTAMFATFAARAPVVATFHASLERSRAVTLFSPLLRAVWRRLAVRMAVSPVAAGFASARFPGELRIVPNGADVELFGSATPAELPPGRALLFVNRLEPRKGFGVAVDAFRLLAEDDPGLRLVVVGEGRQRSALAGLPAVLRDRVLMKGVVTHAELAGFHAAADVFLAPALGGESFGIVLLEAMAARVPVVGSDIPGYRYVLEDGEDGLLVPPGDPVALAGAVRRLLGDPALAERLRDNGRRRAERFRWETVTSEIETAYRDALARRAG